MPMRVGITGSGSGLFTGSGSDPAYVIAKKLLSKNVATLAF
jgi:hypothetical protein